MFRDAPLTEVIAAAGRYSDRPMTAADPRLARIRVTAVLPLTGDEPLTERMDALLPIRVEDGANGQAVIRAD